MEIVRATCWAEWLDSHTPTTAQTLAEEVAAKDIFIREARRELAGVDIGPATKAGDRRFRRGTQAWLMRKFRRARHYDPVERIRVRAARWNLPGTPGRCSRQIHRNLARLRALAPPRVRAAMLRMLFNGWTTDRRMASLAKRPGLCLLRCSPRAADSLEHSFHCPVVAEWCR